MYQQKTPLARFPGTVSLRGSTGLPHEGGGGAQPQPVRERDSGRCGGEQAEERGRLCRRAPVLPHAPKVLLLC